MPAFPRTFREKQALQQARTMAALCASSHPQGRRFPVHRQVSRLGFLRRSTFPAIFSPVAAPIFLGTRSLVCFTVAGTAPVLHRLPMFAEHARVRRAHRCAPVWAVHLSRILYMLTAHLSICYASLTLSRRFAIILMEETAFVDFIRFLCISFRTQGAIFLAPAACLPVTNPINKLRWGCEAVQRAIAKPSGRLRRGETPAIKKLTTEKAPFPQKKKAPLFGALCRTFPP